MRELKVRKVLGGLILAVPVMAQSSCSERSYTTNIGLKFDVKCNINIPSSDIFNVILSDLNACMDACAERGSDENTDPCQAVAWNTNDNRCWMKGRGLTAEQGTAQSSTIMAFSDPTVWTNVKSGCGYDNNTVVTNSNGQQFQVLCDTRYKGDNYDPEIRPTYPNKHTDTLEECLDYCSEGSPFCWGVLFSPTMEGGYHNCYAKNTNGTAVKTSWVAQKDMITAIAWNSVNTTCAGSEYTASNGARFNTSCDHTGDSPDLEQIHASNFEECQDLCAEYKADSGNAACKGVLYQPSSRDGWLNCHLKYGLSNITSLAEWHLAVLDSAAPNSTTPDPAAPTAPTSSGTNTGLIAGAVVGPVVGIAILAALGFFWWRRRRQHKQGGGGFHQQTSQEGSESEIYNNKPQGYPMTPATQYGGQMKHDYMQAPSTPRAYGDGNGGDGDGGVGGGGGGGGEVAEIDTYTTRSASELPAGNKELRHELQG